MMRTGARASRAAHTQLDPREAEWQTTVVQFAGYNGWRWFHPADNRPNAGGHVQDVVAGYPDVTMVRGPRLIFAELKAERGTVSAEQAAWIGQLTAMGVAMQFVVDLARAADPESIAVLPEVPSVETYVWKPSDWPQVQEILARRR